MKVLSTIFCLMAIFCGYSQNTFEELITRYNNSSIGLPYYGENYSECVNNISSYMRTTKILSFRNVDNVVQIVYSYSDYIGFPSDEITKIITVKLYLNETKAYKPQSQKKYLQTCTGFQSKKGFEVEEYVKENNKKSYFLVNTFTIACNSLAMRDRLYESIKALYPIQKKTTEKAPNKGTKQNIVQQKKLTAKQNNKTVLSRTYSNDYFTINYPSSWHIAQENIRVKNTTISVQIMEKQKNDIDFMANVNIIISNEKRKESTSFLAKQTINQSKKMVNTLSVVEQNDNIKLNNCRGSKIEYKFNLPGYNLIGIQYIVKKQDNTTFIITGTFDGKKYYQQKERINSIINSIKIK